MNLQPILDADARLDATLARMTDAEAAEPSRLPGWTRAMCATHIARNADSNAEMVAAALRGESRPQYPGGPAEREAGIEAGRGRTAAEVREDCRAAAARWHEVFSRVTDWFVTVPAGVGPRPIMQRLTSRMVEVEVHHADLGLAYTFRDWPLGFAREQLALRVRALRQAGGPPGTWTVGTHVLDFGQGPWGVAEGEPQAVLAWLMGRETAESAGLAVSGDPRVLTLPELAPFP